MARQIAATIDGFTPIFDVLAGKEGGIIRAAVFGKVWRYCQMERGVCDASQDKIADELGLSRETVNRQLKALVADGYLEDLTPGRKNHPHRYRDTGKISLSAQVTVTENHTGVTQSHSECDAKSHEETETKKETVAARPAIVAAIPPTADVANSVTMEAPAHLRTMPAPNHKRPKWMGVQERDKRLTTYEALTGWKLNKLQEDDICRRVKADDPAWEDCIRKRMSYGCSIRRVSDAIDDYAAGGPVDFKAQRQPQPVTVSAPPSRIEWVTTPAGKILRYDGTPYPGDAGRQKCIELGITYEGN